jgi:hypothetical protein
VRYQERQLLDDNDFFAYPRLLDWLSTRLKQLG